MTKEQALLRETVDKLLTERGFKVVDGFHGSLSQTGEEYVELQIQSNPASIAEYAGMVFGVVTSYGAPGCTVYWRVRPEIPGDARWRTDRVYFRFLTTAKMPMFDEENDAWRNAALVRRQVAA